MTIEKGRGLENSLIGGRGMTGTLAREARPRQKPKRSSHKKHIGFFIALAAIAVIAVAFVPINNSLARPNIENQACSGCHSTAGDFITVTGLPAGQYTPGGVYRITVTVSDPDGAGVNENAFDFLLSSGGGTLTLGSPVDPNVEINNALEASANDAVSPMSTQTWSFTWTAPVSGSVDVNVWAVVGGFGGSSNTGIKAPYDHNTYTLSSTAIPEFPTFIVPVLGMAGAVIVISRLAKKS